MGDNILGLSDSDLIEVGGGKTIIDVLQDFGDKLQKDLVNSLRDKITTITPKLLQQSIVFDIKVLASSYQFELKMNDYWEFVDKGVQGVGGVKKDGSSWLRKNSTSPFSYRDKKPPISELTAWSNAQGANPFAVQNSIFHRGTKATNFYTDVVDDNLTKDLIKNLEDAGAREVQISLKNGISGNSN
jgi:hypothetical protein